MTIERVSAEEYGRWIDKPSHVFNSVEFNELNRHKCDEIHYLLFRDEKGKVRFGIILGQRGNELRSPFSAPFGGVEERDNCRLEYYVELIYTLQKYISDTGLHALITLPPEIYERNGNINKFRLSASTAGTKIDCEDYNFHYPLNKFNEFESRLWDASRRNFRKALKSDFSFSHLSFNVENLRRVYDIVMANHSALGYPVKMTLDDIICTSKVVEMYPFVLSHGDKDVASALYYATTQGIAQLIYWGDLRQYSSLRPMNAMAYYVMCFFAQRGFSIVDLGPASEDGVPALGLCNFKEGLGCELTPKVRIKL